MKHAHRAALAAFLSILCVGAAFAHGDEHGGHDETAAIGEVGDAAHASRTVKVDMSDGMRFSPSHVKVNQGETIRFVVTNSGKLKHEMVLGTEDELKEHYELMKKFPEMEHSDPNMVSVAPGATKEMVWKFSKAGKIQFACLQPGHYDAGMKGDVTVAQTGGKIHH